MLPDLLVVKVNFPDPGGEDWSQVGNMDGIGHKSVLTRLLEPGPGGKGSDNNS